MPYVVAQPVLTRDVLSSLLAKNDSEVAAQQEWEAEWNQAGLASRLSENVRIEKEEERERKGSLMISAFTCNTIKLFYYMYMYMYMYVKLSVIFLFFIFIFSCVGVQS